MNFSPSDILSRTDNVLKLLSLYMINCGTLNLWVSNTIDTIYFAYSRAITILTTSVATVCCFVLVYLYFYVMCRGRRLTPLTQLVRYPVTELYTPSFFIMVRLNICSFMAMYVYPIFTFFISDVSYQLEFSRQSS